MVRVVMRKENNVDARQRNLTFQSRIVTPRPASNNSFCSPASTSVLALNRFTTGSGLPFPRRVTRKSFASERAASAVNETATNVSRIAHNRSMSSSNVTQALIGGCPFEWAQTQLSVRVRVAGRALQMAEVSGINARSSYPERTPELRRRLGCPRRFMQQFVE